MKIVCGTCSGLRRNLYFCRCYAKVGYRYLDCAGHYGEMKRLREAVDARECCVASVTVLARDTRDDVRETRELETAANADAKLSWLGVGGG